VLNYYGKHLVHRIDADQQPSAVVYNILRHVLKVSDEKAA